MPPLTVINLASDVIRIFERTLSCFQNIGILQMYSFMYKCHSDVFFNFTAEKDLEDFISVLEEIKDVLEKLQTLQKQSKATQADISDPGLGSEHFLPAAQFIHGKDSQPDDLQAGVDPVEVISAAQLVQTETASQEPRDIVYGNPIAEPPHNETGSFIHSESEPVSDPGPTSEGMVAAPFIQNQSPPHGSVPVDPSDTTLDPPETTMDAGSHFMSPPHFIPSTEGFVAEPLMTGPDEMNSLMTPAGLDYIVPEMIPEPATPTQSSWISEAAPMDEEPKKGGELDPVVSVNKDKHQCSVCKKVLSSKTSLNAHEATHTGQKPFCCEHCGKLFTESINLAAHLTRQHNLNTEAANPCKECGKLFVRKSALETHMRSHLGLRPWSCELCGKTFTQKVTRDTHLVTHTRDYRFFCDECGKQFPTQAKLNYHIKTHGEPQFSCNLCDKRFSTRQYLNAHYLTRGHDLGRPEAGHCRLDNTSSQVVFSCSHCERSFPSQHTLSLHTHSPLSARFRYLEKRKMAPRQKHRCGVCGREFLFKRSLTHHLQQKHTAGISESQKRPYSCHLCHKTFTLRAKARLHMQTHGQRQQHGCEICGRVYRRKDSLTRHMATTHSATTGLPVCAVCHATSATAAAHKEHMKTHAAHYKCAQCDKVFKSKTALGFHIQHTHEARFKYQCAICTKQFVRKCHYHNHLLSHSTDRPYRCDSCGKGFKDNKTCREHSKRVHTNQIVNASEQITANQMTASQIAVEEIAAGQMAIHPLLAGDDATYGQTYDQFQACVQLQ